MKLISKIRLILTKKELKQLVLIFFGILLLGVFEVIGVSGVLPFIAVVASPEIIFENDYLLKVYIFFNFQSANSFTTFLGLVLISLIFISNSYQAFMNWVFVKFTNMLNYRIATRMLEKYLYKDYEFFLNRNTSDLTKNILNEASRTAKLIITALQVFSKTIISLNFIILLIYVDPLIALFTCLFMGGSYTLIYLYFKNKIHSKGLEISQYSFHLLKAINESMSGIKDIKLHSNEAEFLKRFSLPAKKIAINQALAALISTTPRYLLEVIAFGGIVAIIVSLLAINGSDNNLFPIISLYAMVGYRLLPAFQQIYSGVSTLKFDLPALDNIVHEFNDSSPIKIELTETYPIIFRDKISINKVNFVYEGSNANILSNLELEILKNTTIGIVGSTGSGKTTLIDIILSLLIPSSGSVLIDGVEITSKNRFEWQKQIGYVPQSIYLTDDSILANIAFGAPFDEIDLRQAEKASKMANIHNFIQTLPAKYDTLVGERGVRLSGGQIQRIGIARALYHDPDVLVLDEATSSLDGLTETSIIEAIRNLLHEKTIILIAHRISTVKDCDTIHLMENGNIKESGSYEYLMKNSDEFRKIAKKS
jgi:ATP-binding cassette, subfamily B, bacterial PglK